MENPPDIFFSIIQGNENDIYKIEFFLTYPVSNWTNQVFWYTKQYHFALDFFERAEAIFLQYGNLLPQNRALRLKLEIINGKLRCYDYLDWFQKYITFYEDNRSYLENNYQTHYEFIKEKQRLFEKGIPIGNMLHKTRDKLSDEEKARRDKYFLQTFDVYVSKYKELQSWKNKN